MTYSNKKTTNQRFKSHKRKQSKRWYAQFTNGKSNIDSVMVALIENIVDWHRPIISKDASGNIITKRKFPYNIYSTSYPQIIEQLRDQYNLICTHRTLTRKFVKLEEMSYMKRVIRNTSDRGVKVVNRLFIELSNELYKLVTAEDDSKSSSNSGSGSSGSNSDSSVGGGCKKLIDFYPLSEEDHLLLQKSLEYKFSLDEMNDILKCKSMQIVKQPKFYTKYSFIRYMSVLFNRESQQIIANQNKNQIVDKVINISAKSSDLKSDRYRQKASPYISINNKYINRSNESNFKDKILDVDSSKNTNISNHKSEIYQNPKILKDFHPISQTDCDLLQRLSGREFNLKATNEILLSLSDKLQSRKFYSKKGFILYMTQILLYEKRQAELINNESFTINANKTTEEMEEIKNDRYLEQIESSRSNAKDAILKRKLVPIFSKEKACEIIRNYKYYEIKNNKCKIYLSKYIDLQQYEKEKILQEITSIDNQMKNDKLVEIKSIEYMMPKPDQDQDQHQHHNSQNRAGGLGLELELESKNTNNINNTTKAISIIPENIWGKVRMELIKYYGRGIDQSWFSKLELEMEIDSNSESKDKAYQKKASEYAKSFKLRAENNFYMSWISQNYQDTISKVANNLGFEFDGIECE